MSQKEEEILDQPSDGDQKPLHALSYWDAGAWALILLSWLWRLMHWPFAWAMLSAGIIILLVRSSMRLIRAHRRKVDWIFFVAQAALVLLLTLRLYSVQLPGICIYIILATFLFALLLKTTGYSKRKL
jgi:hypothetical protein